MQMTPEARAWLDGTVRRILARHPLGDAERAGITYELMSHLHAGGEARASAAGRGEVAREDLEAALAEAGGEKGLTEAFVQPLAKPVERLFLGRRLGAYAIDMFLVLVGLVLVHHLLELALYSQMGAAPRVEEPKPNVFLPWGFHDPEASLLAQGVFTLVSAAWVLGYFTFFEARDGRSPGKRALDLQVMRVDGAPMTAREAILRNVAKLFPPIFILDVLVGLIAFSKDKQRVSDKIAQTIVVRA